MYNQRLNFFQRLKLKIQLTHKEREELYFRAKAFKRRLILIGATFPSHGLCAQLSRPNDEEFNAFHCMIPIIAMWKYLGRNEDNILPISRIDSDNGWNMWQGPSLVARKDLLEFTINALRSTLQGNHRAQSR